jgi:cytoskeletal protein CcmA (bactofilin family)
MFNRKADGRPSGPSAPPPSGGSRGRGMFSVIGPDMLVAGNVRATADLHVDGRIEGDVDCGNLVQGADSRVIGTVTAETARLAGTVEGGVRVRQLTVERSARVAGDVEYETITVEHGGQIEGRLKHMGTSDTGALPGPRALPNLPPPAANEEAA